MARVTLASILDRPAPQRAGRRVVAVPRRGGAVADLRRHRIVNFAHGSLYMLGLYVAYSLVEWLWAAPLGFWGACCWRRSHVGVLGAADRVLVLRRIYRAPELFQLLATFALVLVVKDACSGPGAPKTCSDRARPACRGGGRDRWAGAFPPTTCS
jgi:hypothetical protein